MWLRIGLLVTIFLAAIGWLYLVVTLAPELKQPSGEESNAFGRENIKFPSSLEDLRQLAYVLQLYMKDEREFVLVLFTSAYLFKQTFAIPGSVFMNVLAGAVFGLPVGFGLCCFLTACGASSCFLLAKICGRQLAVRYFPERIHAFKEKLEMNRDRLPYFLLFLRLFPMSPNWALNMSCGVLGVPMWVCQVLM